MSYFLVCAISMLAGYLFGSVGVRHQRNADIQLLIDVEAAKRKDDGIYRVGDEITETMPSESGVFRVRERQR